MKIEKATYALDSNTMAELTPSQQGFALEDAIHNALCKLPDVECLREQDIRSKYNDQSLNGVDHWIRYQNTNILIQDKWKETATTQQEVSQFLGCVERIQARCSSDDVFYLIWAGKNTPTSHSATTLKERTVQIIHCAFSIEALARLVILDVCETLGVDPIESLRQIPVAKKARIATIPSRRDVVVVQPQTTASVSTVPYDETDEGKQAKARLEGMIQQIHNTQFRKINNAQSNSTVPDVWQIYQSAFPQDIHKWTDGTFKKIDFNAFLRTMKAVTYPTKTKHFRSYCFFFYVKLRYISVELATISTQYNNCREQMLANKSVWARKLPQIKCTAEPMTDVEYRAQVVYCEDYWMNTYGPGGTIVKKPSGLDYQFHQQYIVY
jgi:hypothetical protein